MADVKVENIKIPFISLQPAPATIKVSLPPVLTPDNAPIIVDFINNPRNESIDFQINGKGGESSAILTIANAIVQAKKEGKKITGTLLGNAYSGHANLACFVDDLKHTNGSSLTFHSVGGYRTINFLHWIFPVTTYRTYNVDAEDRVASSYQDQVCVAKEILTQADIEAMANGQKVTYVYITPKERIRFVEADYGNNIFDKILDISMFFAGLAVFFLVIVGIKRI